MRLAALLFLTAVAACAGTGGAWPTLAPRPIEHMADGVAPPASTPSASTPLGSTLPVAPVPPPPLPSQPAPPGIADVPARLSVIERDRTDLASRITAQLAATRSAVAARGTRTEGDAWAKAQLEVTRLERLGSQVTDLYDRLDTIAGALAEAGAAGAEIAAPLRATGEAIRRVRVLEGEVTAGLAGAGSAAP